MTTFDFLDARTCRRIVMALFLGIGAQGHSARAEDASNLEVHEWSVWVGEPGVKQLNAVADYKSAMPVTVETDRSRRPDAEKPGPNPLTLLTVYGEPPDVADIDVKITAGRPVAQWPKSEGKANRLRWLDLKLTKDLSDKSGLAYVPDGHWFHKARELGGLYLHLHKGGRVERFLAYDLELQAMLPIRLDGGPDTFKVVNTGKHPLYDVMLIVPGESGRRVGWANKVDPAPPAAPGQGNPAPGNKPGGTPAAAPAAKVAVAAPAGAVVVAAAPVAAAPVAAAPAAGAAAPAGAKPGAANAPAAAGAPTTPSTPETSVDLVLGNPLSAESDEAKQATVEELRNRLTKAGLKPAEIELIFSLYSKHIFETDEMLLLYRWGAEALDEMTLFAVEPETAKVQRLALVIVKKADPKLRDDVTKLVAELGDKVYSKREQAEKRLTELGRIALPALKEALKNTDIEVVTRAERILLGQKEQLGNEGQ